MVVFVNHLNITLERILQASSQNRHLGIFVERVVRSGTPYHVDVGVELVEEVVYLLHLPHNDGVVFAGVDIEEDAFGIADIIAIEKGRVEGVDDSLLHPVLSVGTAHGHDGSASIPHGGLHVAEVEVDAPVAMNGDELRYSLDGILQDVVGSQESLLDRDVRVDIDVAEPLVVDDEHRVDILAQFVHALESFDDLPLLLEIKGDGDDTNGQQSHLLRHFGNDRSRSRACSATHTGSHKDHSGAVREQFLDVVDVRFCLTLAQLRIGTGTQARIAQQYLDGYGRGRQRLAVGVADSIRHTGNSLAVHIPDGIASSAANTYHLDDALHLVLDGDKEV